LFFVTGISLAALLAAPPKGQSWEVPAMPVAILPSNFLASYPAKKPKISKIIFGFQYF
jgi:hypothetical protein